MKRLFNTKKRVAFLATFVVVAASAIGAYAFITTGGTGSGSATAGSANGLTIAVTVTPGLVPGGSEPVTYTIHNTNLTASVVVAGVTGVTSETGACQTADAGALAGDITYADTTNAGATPYPQTIAPGGTFTTGTGTVSEVNDGLFNQNVCLSPNVTTVTLTST